MGRYAAAAVAADRAVANNSDPLSGSQCMCPANNLVYEFLLEVRRMKIAEVGPAPDSSAAAFIASLKRAADGVAAHPLRLVDARSAQDARGVGAATARLLADELWAAFPPPPPSADEAAAAERFRAAARAAERDKARAAAARKRAAEAEAGAPLSQPASQPPPAAQPQRASAPLPTGAGAGADADDGDAAAGPPKKRPKKAPKAPKEYVPAMGSANYAFLLTLLRAQRGPERVPHLGKAELMARAEASGLADRPIQGDGGPPPPAGGDAGGGRGRGGGRGGRGGGGWPPGGGAGGRGYYSGWSCLNSQLVNRHCLVMTWSNPVKVALTPAGLALAERMHRDAVARGKLPPLAGIPDDGPLLFQEHGAAAAPAAAPPAAAEAPGAAAAGARRARAAAAAGSDGSLEDASEDQGGGGGGSGGGSDPFSLPLRERLARAAAAAPPPRRLPRGSDGDPEGLGAADYGGAGERRARAAGAAAASRDTGPSPNEAAHLPLLLEMGFPEARARRALRASADVQQALDIVDVLSSPDESGSPRGGALPPPPGAARRSPQQQQQQQQQVQQVQQAQQRQQSAPAPAASDSSLPSLGHIRGGARFEPAGGAPRGGAPPPPTAAAAPPWRVTRETARLPPLPRGARYGAAYDTVLLVDGREQYSRAAAGAGASRTDALAAHLAAMRAAGVPVEQRHLPVGDALWVARPKGGAPGGDEFVLDFILERKSLDDLLASIKGGGRYESQKLALRRCGCRHLYYLLEGDPDALPSPADARAARSAAAATEVEGFRVLRTSGVADTLRAYRALTAAVAGVLAPLAPRRGAPPGGELPRFPAWAARVAGAGRLATTLHDVWGLMLAEVPGLGPDGVRAVLAAYGTPAALWAAYRGVLARAAAAGRPRAAAADECAALLAGARAPGGARALGAARARRVWELLFQAGWEVGPPPAAA